MALVLNDRVKETTTTTGTGTINLAGAATNFETFVAGIGDGNTVYYAIVHQDQPEFEVGLGTVTDATPDTLSRTTILSSSNSDGLVSFSAGTKDVFCTLPASKTVFQDSSGQVGIGTQSPQVPLHVSHATAPNFRLSRTGTGQIYQFGIDSSGRFAISEAASEGGTKHQRFIIDDSGEVGIGVTPESNLHIKTSVDNSVAQGLIIERSANTDKGYINYQGGAFRFIATDGDPIKIGHVSNTDRVEITSGGDVTLTGNLTHASDLTLDSGGDITLDADGADIIFADGGTNKGKIALASDILSIVNVTQDADIKFDGLDGSSSITALRLDMSDAGTASFNHDIKLVDNGIARFGAGEDLLVFHDGSNNYIVSNTQDIDLLIQGNDGGSTITALSFDMSDAGAATFNNNVTAFSDERLKDNIKTLEDGLDKVEQLRGVTYTRDEKENIGVIAQEVEKILPEIVKTADDEMGTKSVDYSRITAVLIEAVKELSARVKELESK